MLGLGNPETVGSLHRDLPRNVFTAEGPVRREPGCGVACAFLLVGGAVRCLEVQRIIREGYALLDLITYFTAGPKETRAWTIAKGTKAPQAAGVIHGDFERGFIRAQTIAYDDFVSLGGEVAAKEAGKARDEGKEYVVQDGDVLMFKFNT